MALTPGTRLGAYEITAQIGKGGMGEVYRATDTKLKRQVAIKILPTSFATDQDRLARFQREAEVLASLNHPNIAGIYGIEETDGARAEVGGTFEVYVRAIAANGQASGEPRKISNSGGSSPAWSTQSREVLYRAGDQIMTVSYTMSGDSFVPEKPRVWASNVGGVGGFDLASDGKRVAMIVPLATKDVSHRESTVAVVVNFFDELRRRAPIGQ